MLMPAERLLRRFIVLALQAFDLDGSGEIDEEELTELLKRLAVPADEDDVDDGSERARERVVEGRFAEGPAAARVGVRAGERVHGREIGV